MIVLDTNVISELARTPDPRSEPARAWMRAQRIDDLWITSVTYAEILAGVAAMPDGRRKRMALEAANAVVMVDLDGRVLPFGAESAEAFARISAERRSKGLSVQTANVQIAAIAMTCGFALATRNVSDFGAEGLVVVNPWDHRAP